jgi:hypothetical protein
MSESAAAVTGVSSPVDSGPDVGGVPPEPRGDEEQDAGKRVKAKPIPKSQAQKDLERAFKPRLVASRATHRLVGLTHDNARKEPDEGEGEEEPEAKAEPKKAAKAEEPEEPEAPKATPAPKPAPQKPEKAAGAPTQADIDAATRVVESKGEGPFEFAGKRYATRAQAEQAHRTIQNVFKTMQKRVSDAEAAASAQARQLAALQVAPTPGPQAQPRQAAPEQQPLSPRPTGPTSIDEVADAIDFDTANALVTEHGFTAEDALRHVFKDALKSYDSYLGSRIDPLLQQDKEQKETAALHETFKSNFSKVQTEMYDDDSEVVFPELQDVETVKQVVETWHDAHLPNTPEAIALVALALRGLGATAREAAARRAAAGTVPVQAPGSQPPAETRPPADAAALALGDGDRQHTRPGGETSEEARRFSAILRRRPTDGAATLLGVSRF